VATTPVAKAKLPVVFVALGVLRSAHSGFGSEVSAHAAVTLIRPHDPPHLHTFPLLI
jgi:hypothetical protein